jgi:hypothetical protein
MTGPATIFVTLAEAARQAGADAVVSDITHGQRTALGRQGGEGMPCPIPREHFLIVRDPPAARWKIDESEGANRFPGGITWVDRLSEAPWLDIAGNAIHCGGALEWTDIQVSVLDAMIAAGDDPQLPDRPAQGAAVIAAWTAANALWKGRVPRKPTSELHISINRWLARQPDMIEGRINNQVSLDSVKRAIGRKNGK